MFVRISTSLFIMDSMNKGAQNRLRSTDQGKTSRSDSVVVFLVLVTTFFMFGFNNANTSVMPEYFLHIGGDPLIAGAQNSLCVLVAVGLRFGFGPLADRIGSKPLMAIGAIGFLIPCAVMPLCASLEEAFGLRILQAIGLAAFHPNVARYITAVSAPDTTTKRISFSRIASTASLMVIPAFLLPLAQDGNWVGFFIAMSLMATISLVIILILPADRIKASKHGDAPDTGIESQPQGDRKMAPSECRDTVRGNRLNEASDKGHPKSSFVALAHLTKSSYGRSLLLAMVAPTLASFGYSIVLAFGPMYMTTVLPEMNSGLVLSAMSVGGLAGSYAIGKRVFGGNMRTVICLFLFILCAGLACFSLSSLGLAVALISAVLIGFSYFGVITALVTEVSIKSDMSISGTMLAMQQNNLDIGIMLGSLFAGVTLQAGMTMGICLLIVGFIVAIGATCWYILYKA